MKRNRVEISNQLSFELKEKVDQPNLQPRGNVVEFPHSAARSPLQRFRERVVADLLRTRVPKQRP